MIMHVSNGLKSGTKWIILNLTIDIKSSKDPLARLAEKFLPEIYFIFFCETVTGICFDKWYIVKIQTLLYTLNWDCI